MLAKPKAHPIKALDRSKVNLQTLLSGERGVPTAKACGNSKGMARAMLDKIYGLRPWSRGKGQNRKVGSAMPRYSPTLPRMA